MANLKTEIDQLKARIRENNLEISDTRDDNRQIKDTCEHRLLEIQRLKAENTDVLNFNFEVTEERARLEAQLASLRDEKRRLLNQIDSLNSSIADTDYKNNELDKVIKDLELEKRGFQKDLATFESDNDRVELDIKKKEDTLRMLDQQILDTTRTIRNLEADIQATVRVNDEKKDESLHFLKNLQAEISHNQDLNARIINSENVLR